MKTSFFLALMFLTRIPVPRLASISDEDQGRALIFYPLVGLLIGLLLGLFSLILTPSLPLLGGALLVMVWVFITGGLHIDGLADSADAWLGGLGDKTRTLDIMKDPRAGSAAVMAVVCVLLVKFAALASMSHSLQLIALVTVPALARCVPACLFLTTPYAREQGSALAMLNYLQPRWVLGVVVVVVALVALTVWSVLGWRTGIFFAILAIQLWLLRALMLARINGVTGDTVGASVEITEMSALALMLLLIN